MERQLAPRKTSRLLAYRLHHALHSGSLREVVDALPTTSAPPPFPPRPTRAPLSVFDSSIYDGTCLLGAAATVLFQPAEFRRAVFALLLECGASPYAAGDNGMAAEWVLYRIKGEQEMREWCLHELGRAKEAQRNMVRYEAPSEVHDWIENELAALDAEVEYEHEPEQVDDEDTPMQDYDELDNLDRHEPIQAPPAKRPRVLSPLPDYEDAEHLAERSHPYLYVDAPYAAAGHARARDEPVQDPPRPSPAVGGSRPWSSAPGGLTQHEARVFAPLIGTLRRAPNGTALASRVGQELPQFNSAVYKLDPDLSTWRPYVARAEELGLVELGRGAVQGRDWVRLRPSYLHETPRRHDSPPPTSSSTTFPSEAHNRPPSTGPPQARPPSPPRPPAHLRRPPPPPLLPLHSPHEPSFPHPTTASAADAAQTSTSVGSFASSAPRQPLEPDRGGLAGSPKLSQPPPERIGPPQEAPEPVVIDRREPIFPKRRRSPSPRPDYRSTERAAPPHSSSTSAYVQGGGTRRVGDGEEVSRAASRPAPVRAQLPPRPRWASRLHDDDADVFEPLVETLRPMKAGRRWVRGSDVGERMRPWFPDVYKRDRRLGAWKAYAERAHKLGIITLQPLSNAQDEVRLAAEFDVPDSRSPSPFRYTRSPRIPSPDRPERSTTALPPRPAPYQPTSMPPTHPLLLAEPSTTVSERGPTTTSSSSTDKIGQSWEAFTASRQKPSPTTRSSVPGVPVMPRGSSGATPPSSTSSSPVVPPVLGASSAPLAASAPPARSPGQSTSSTSSSFVAATRAPEGSAASVALVTGPSAASLGVAGGARPAPSDPSLPSMVSPRLPEPSSASHSAPDPAVADRREPILVKRSRSSSPMPDQPVAEPVVKRQMVIPPLAVSTDILKPVGGRDEPARAPPCPAPAPVPAAPAPVPAPAAVPRRPREASRLTDDEAHVFEPLIKTLRSMKARDRWVLVSDVGRRMCREFYDVYRRDPALSFWKPYGHRAQELRIITIDERERKPSLICLTAEFATARAPQPSPPPSTIAPVVRPEHSTTVLPPRPSSLLLDPAFSVPAPPPSLEPPGHFVSTTVRPTSAGQGGAASTSSPSADEIGQSWREFTANRQKPRSSAPSIMPGPTITRPTQSGAASSSTTSVSAAAQPVPGASSTPLAAGAPPAGSPGQSTSSSSVAVPRAPEGSAASPGSFGPGSSTTSLGVAGAGPAALSDSSALPMRVNLLDVLRGDRARERSRDAPQRPLADEPLGPRVVQGDLTPVSLEMARSASVVSMPQDVVGLSASAADSSMAMTRRATSPSTARPAPSLGAPGLDTSSAVSAVAPAASAVAQGPAVPASTSMGPPSTASLHSFGRRVAPLAAAAPVSSAASSSASAVPERDPSARASEVKKPPPPSTASAAPSGWTPSATQSLGSSVSGADFAALGTATAASGPPPRSVSRLPRLARPPPPPPVARPRPPSSTPRSVASSASSAPDPPPPVQPAPPSQQTSTVHPGWAPTFPSALAPPGPAASIPRASSHDRPPHWNTFAPTAYPSTTMPSFTPTAPAAFASAARAPAQQRVAGFVTVEVHLLPPYATENVLRMYLLRGPSVFESLPSAAQLDQLDALVRGGEFRSAAAQLQQQRQHDEPPPVPKRVQVVIDEKPGLAQDRRWAQVTYKTRADADRARAIFNGKRLVEGPAGMGEQGLMWIEQGSEIARFRTQAFR
ncbi:hypothetical protein JCM3775_007019 [Rhodotorula graminis]